MYSVSLPALAYPYCNKSLFFHSPKDHYNFSQHGTKLIESHLLLGSP